VTHEHRIEILPQDANFALELDARSAEGWELVVAMVAGWAPTGILGADGRAAAVPVLSCVFRRVNVSPREEMAEVARSVINQFLNTEVPRPKYDTVNLPHGLTFSSIMSEPTPEGRADDHLIVKG
jgi:hypothetical protein